MTSVTQIFRRLLPTFLILPLLATLAGCGAGTATQLVAGRLAFVGEAHGGVQPVSGAIVQLFSVGTGGNGSLAADILVHPLATGTDGSFNVTSDYTCSSPNEQLYLVVRGGNPGLQGNVSNPALVLLSALGSCTNLLNNPNAFVYVNEVSTVAAVYTLAPFMSSYDHVGASATNIVGLNNAFLNAQLLANTSNGEAAALASNLVIEQAKLYALANAIVPCVNSDGSACGFLFSAATQKGGIAPTNTVSALVNIIKHPGSNVAAVFNLIGPTPPYPGALKKAPNDWTMSLTVTGGGLFEPTALSVDKAGNVWVANFGGGTSAGPNPQGVVAYSPQGIPFSGTPFASNQALEEVFGLTLDRNGDVWTTAEENVAHGSTKGSIAKLAGSESSAPGAFLGTFIDNSLEYPESIASDPSNGNILVANYAGNTATIFDSNGNFLKNVGAGYSVFPIGITSDGAGGVWLANEGYYTLTHIKADGSVQVPRCCSEPYTVALDPDGDVWATNFIEMNGGYTVSEVGKDGTVLIPGVAVPGLNTPGRGAMDAGGQFWVLNYHDSTFLGIAGNHSTLPVGSPLSPMALGRDAMMVEPFGIATDPSGNLWVTNRVENSLVMFFGLATPTATPSLAAPEAP